jgi:hypothetical protein
MMRVTRDLLNYRVTKYGARRPFPNGKGKHSILPKGKVGNRRNHPIRGGTL